MALPAADLRVRLAAFEWLREQVDIHGDVLPYRLLLKGLTVDGERVPLVSQQGIFKPRVLPEIPLSIRTSVEPHYRDTFGSDGLLLYDYRGKNPWHRENVGLRRAMEERAPLVYFHGVLEGRYLAAWPVFIVGDDPKGLRFTVALDDATHVGEGIGRTAAEPAGAAAAGARAPGVDEDLGAAARRSYITGSFKVRLHQRAFRERVLAAYRSQCALCRLRHEALLDAAHITPDADPEGEPVVSNGLALCKLHHAAYDKYFLTVRPDYVIEIRRSILEEEDGPMLLHGLKGLHGKTIEKPRKRGLWPDPGRLEKRWERFVRSGAAG